MPIIYKPKTEELQAMLAESGQARDMWAEGFLTVVKRVLLKDPLRYRSFGPWWWLVKAAFLKREESAFGETIDDTMIDDMTYGDETLDLLAAFAYQDAQVSRGIMHESQHVLDADGDPIKFFSNDEDMEQRAAVKKP